MELYQCRYVLAVAREGNFSRAAEKLFITQPTLSQQIKKLENELGFSLFDRTTKKVSLTPFGKQFVDHASKAVDSFDEFEVWLNTAKEVQSSKITFGASALTMPHISGCVPDFISLFPDVSLAYYENWDPILMEQVESGNLDMALVALPNDSEKQHNFSSLPILEEYVCVVVNNSHPLFNRTSVTLEDLAEENIVSTSSQSGLQGLMKHEFARHGLKPNFTMNLVSVEARLSMVRKGAVTLVMNRQFEIYQEADLAVIPIEPKVFRTLSLITAKNHKLSVAEKSFQEIVRKWLLSRFGETVK